MNAPLKQEAVGSSYSIDAMQHAQAMTWRAIDRLAAQIRPGMRESEAQALGLQILTDLDMEKAWHPLLVRFGQNTLKIYSQKSEGDPVLQPDDIFFIDLGGVWGGHEGDAGATFTVGSDTEMQACADAAKALYQRVEAHWRAGKVSGIDLYDFAAREAETMGWRLNLDIKGHRVSDYPHSIYKAGDLGDFAACPDVGLWILEIQIAHLSRPFGAFYEDLLV